MSSANPTPRRRTLKTLSALSALCASGAAALLLSACGGGGGSGGGAGETPLPRPEPDPPPDPQPDPQPDPPPNPRPDPETQTFRATGTITITAGEQRQELARNHRITVTGNAVTVDRFRTTLGSDGGFAVRVGLPDSTSLQCSGNMLTISGRIAGDSVTGNYGGTTNCQFSGADAVPVTYSGDFRGSRSASRLSAGAARDSEPDSDLAGAVRQALRKALPPPR